MNESKNNVATMYQNIPAVAALNHVPGFEPAKLLRRTRSRKTNEVVLKLALPYKKLWFRLANPKGRIRLNALTITEQMAIYEAQVYLDRSDTEPISSFTARCAKEDATVEDYIRAAQEEAMDEALSMAGFGLQFADVGMTEAALRYGSEIPLASAVTRSNSATTAPLSDTKAQTNMQQNHAEMPIRQPSKQAPMPIVRQAATSAAQSSVQVTRPIGTQPAQAISQNQPIANIVRPMMQTPQAAPKVKEQEKLPASESPAEESLPVTPMTEQPAESKVNANQDTLPLQEEAMKAQKAVNILQMHTAAKESGRNAPSAMEGTATQISQAAAESAPKYTQDMPVEEIIKQMTFEEAKSVVVDTGSCNGWTIEEVSQKRPPSLKFYVYGGYKGENNILRAAAQIMLDHLEARKAG